MIRTKTEEKYEKIRKKIKDKERKKGWKEERL